MSTPLEGLGPAAPPRSNGELVFEQPWHSRAFGMAVALHESGEFAWPQFQSALVARITNWEAEPTEQWTYYDHWLQALEHVLASRGTLPSEDVTARALALAGRPHGHDHR